MIVYLVFKTWCTRKQLCNLIFNLMDLHPNTVPESLNDLLTYWPALSGGTEDEIQ